MVHNYSIKELSRTVTRAVFKRHLLSPLSVHFSSVQFSSVQFSLAQLNSKQLLVFLSTTATVVATSPVYESLCGHLGIIIQNIYRVKVVQVLIRCSIEILSPVVVS